MLSVLRQNDYNVRGPSKLNIAENSAEPTVFVIAFSKICVWIVAFNIAYLFRLRNIVMWMYRILNNFTLITIEMVVVLNIIFINVFWQFFGNGDNTSTKVTNSSYTSKRILKTRVLHEVFWSPKNVTIFRSSSNESSISFFEPRILLEAISRTIMNDTHSTSCGSYLADQSQLLTNSKPTLASRFEMLQSPLPSQSNENHLIQTSFNEPSQSLVEDTDPLPVSRSKSYFSKKFFNQAKRATNDNESITSSIQNENAIEIISISKDNKKYF
ncbi:hypothetical protein CLIB1423_01S10660 [[Candida] railenensis]|uniref:Uncharacterized protein n=1 Tax=[Candida] railenensis TaxID=45579 RepID=A0A9P0QL84_9ASCO|nr:hypothetical protein CLIB1423_01S10660 [[Candida] railenensis]